MAESGRAYLSIDKGLLEYCATDCGNNENGTPLYMALPTVEKLVELGADVNLQGSNGAPLHAAIMRNNK